MRKKLMILTMILIAGLLSGCGKKESNQKLIENASPKTSALGLWKYEDGKVERSFLYDPEEEQKLIDTMNGWKCRPVDEVKWEDLSGTMYGIEITDTNGEDLLITWLDGYGANKKGETFKVDADFAKIEEEYQWRDLDHLPFNTFPNLYHLALNHRTWNEKFLTKSNELSKVGMIIEIVEFKDNQITACLKNPTAEEIMYGEYFTIQAKLDDIWYDIPVKENWGFNDIAYLLEAGAENEKTYNISLYGDLPAGQYRLVVEGATAEFSIK